MPSPGTSGIAEKAAVRHAPPAARPAFRVRNGAGSRRRRHRRALPRGAQRRPPPLTTPTPGGRPAPLCRPLPPQERAWEAELRRWAEADASTTANLFAQQLWTDFSEQHRRELQQQGEQLRTVAELSAVTCGFALMGFFQVGPTTTSPLARGPEPGCGPTARGA